MMDSNILVLCVRVMQPGWYNCGAQMSNCLVHCTVQRQGTIIEVLRTFPSAQYMHHFVPVAIFSGDLDGTNPAAMPGLHVDSFQSFGFGRLELQADPSYWLEASVII
jgi:hypothetical protein